MKILATLAISIIAAALVVIGIGTFLAPDGLSHCEERPSTQQDCHKVDAIVAISGGDTTARTAQAIQLYKDGWADVLIFSGAALDKTGPSNAEAMRQQALNAGVSSNDILIDETSETTKQNAVNSTDLFESRNIHSVILVTSAYHQRRAGLEFGQRAGIEVRIVNHPVRTDNQWSQLWWTTPTGWWLAVSELFKIGAFYIGGTR
jgi:uncharacterized SAM-binding protein YcdF (DUF218 family)